jgi:hypothetical protein
MPGAIATGAVATSTSTTVETPTSIQISIAVNIRAAIGDKGADLNIGRSIAKAFLIETRQQGKSLTAQVPTTRLSLESSFADEPNREDRILVVVVRVIVAERAAWATAVVQAAA